jgi:hypothetical protein
MITRFGVASFLIGKSITALTGALLGFESFHTESAFVSFHFCLHLLRAQSGCPRYLALYESQTGTKRMRSTLNSLMFHHLAYRKGEPTHLPLIRQPLARHSAVYIKQPTFSIFYRPTTINLNQNSLTTIETFRPASFAQYALLRSSTSHLRMLLHGHGRQQVDANISSSNQTRCTYHCVLYCVKNSVEADFR